MKKFLIIVSLLFSMVSVTMGEVVTSWLSQAVVPGEQTRLFIILTDGEMPQNTPLPRVKGASLKWTRGNYIRWSGSPNQSAFLLSLEVIPDAPGTVHIPSLTLKTVQGKTYTTEPQTLTVYPYSAIQWNSLNMDGKKLTYGMFWHVADKTPYAHQPDSCELKIYAPENILDYALPTIKSTNLSSWRFEPTFPDLLGGAPHGSVLYKGTEWRVISFQSMLFALRPGDVTASGSIKARAVMPEADPLLATFSRMEQIVEMSIPPISLSAKGLPTGAPAGFNNAVGKFTISAQTDAQDLAANEPITVTIKVEGQGNIQSMACPTLTDSSNWKLYPANRVNTTQDERTISGAAVFQQMMRPIAQTDAIPSFELSFFNPETQQYQTVRTNPIPLEWKSSAIIGAVGTVGAPEEAPPAGIVPVAEMKDIYGIAPPAIISSLIIPSHPAWYFMAYIPAVVLLGIALSRMIRRYQKKNLASKLRQHAFKILSQETTRSSGADFLKEVGSFIESNIPPAQQNEAIKSILQQRDEVAFKPDAEDTNLSAQQRNHMLKEIKKSLSSLSALTLALLLSFAFTDTATADDDSLGMNAYQQGEYAEALGFYHKQIQDEQSTVAERAYANYCAGDVYYRMNKPGEAALHFRRALELAPYFTEARCNLQFIERKEGAILPQETTEYQWLSFMSYGSLIPIAILSGAVLVSCLAFFTLSKKYRISLTVLAVLSGLVAVAAVMNRLMYPLSPSSVPADRLLIVVDKVPARHAADKDSPVIMSLTPSTPLILRAERGSWYYADTFQNTPVWVPKDSCKLLSNGKN